MFSDGQLLTAGQLNALVSALGGDVRGLLPTNAADADNDLTFSAGAALDPTLVYGGILAAAITKRADATWAAGTNAGGLAAGVTFDTDTMHSFLLIDSSDPTNADVIYDDDDAATNALADAAVIAAGFTHARRIASFKPFTSAVWPGIAAARENGGGALRIDYKVPQLDLDDYVGATTRQTLVLSVPFDGVTRVDAVLSVYIAYASGGGHAWVRTNGYTDAVAGANNADVAVTGAANGRSAAEMIAMASNAGQVAHRQSTTAVELSILTKGFIDHRRV